MTEEGALLQAVIADPDDDAPRLIYADWLDEHGQSERAEFIRVQVALATPHNMDEYHAELKRHERRLLRRFREKWSQPLRPVVRQAGFQRGFLESVICLTDEFLDRGERLFTLAPIRHVWLLNPFQHAQQVSRCPYLHRPLHLSLSHGWLGDREVQHLATSPLLSRLTSLALERNRITNAGAIHLARSPYLGSLDDLYLQHNDISREARAELRRRYGPRVHF